MAQTPSASRPEAVQMGSAVDLVSRKQFRPPVAPVDLATPRPNRVNQQTPTSKNKPLQISFSRWSPWVYQKWIQSMTNVWML